MPVVNARLLLPREILVRDQFIADVRKILGSGACTPICAGIFSTADAVEIVDRIFGIIDRFSSYGSYI